MNAGYEHLIDRGLEAMGLHFTAEQRGQLDRYIAELELFNPTYKLVGAEGEELIVRHIFDSLSAVQAIDSLIEDHAAPTLADLGSGAGLPGIPLSIALPQVRVSLVERMERRVNFLRSAVVRATLVDRVAVVDQDLAHLEHRYDVVVFRALKPLSEILDQVAPLLCDGGTVVAYKGQRPAVEAELAEVAERCKSRWSWHLKIVEVPGLDAQRTLCLLRKI